MRLEMWMMSCPEAMGWGFWVIFEKKKTISWDSNSGSGSPESWESTLGEAGWFLDLGEASLVGLRDAPRVVGSDGTVKSKNCVCLSLLVLKT